MAGGLGDDQYKVDHTSDTVTEVVGQGTDEVLSSATLYTLAANVENLTITNDAGAAAVGNGNSAANVITVEETSGVSVDGAAGADSITGAAGADSLDGGAGADSIDAAAGNDIIYVDNTGDTVVGGGDTDTVRSTVTYTIGATVENLILTGIDNLNGTGNASANTLTGNDGNNSLSGLAGADTMDGGLGNDNLSGGDDADTLTGGAGTDTLDGGAGSDTMAGGTGDDTYVFGTGDTITEGASEGTDLVQSAVNVDISTFANVENITLSAGAAAVGNSIANAITGSSSADTITGGDGADTLTGAAGDDFFFFNTSDVDANETITGGDGNDTFRIVTTTDFTNLATTTLLTAGGVERIQITGGQQATFTGAQLTGQAISVNEVADGSTSTLNIDVASAATVNFSTMTFTAAGSGDAFDGGADVVDIDGAAGAENITGTTVADNIDAGDANDTVDGGTGADTIDGGAGVDSLTGGAGADTFLFDTSDVASGEAIAGGSETDTITVVTSTDFSSLTTATILTAGSVEQILITSGQAATFTGAQLTGQAIAVNATAAGAATLNIDVASGGTVNFSTMTFTAFGSNDAFTTGTDVIDIDGAAGGETIVGTTLADNIDGAAGADNLTGGTGADTINLGTDSDADKLYYTAATDGGTAGANGGGDSVSNFVAANDAIEFDGALQTAIDDVGGANATFAFVSASDADGNAAEALDENAAEAAFINRANNIGGTAVNAATLGNVTSVAAQFEAQFDLSNSAAADDMLFVLEASDTTGTFGVYLFVDTNSDATIEAAELRVLAIVTGDAVTTADFVMA